MVKNSDKSNHSTVFSVLNRLKTITSSVMFATEAETLGEVLERIAEASRDLVRARYAALGIPNGVGGLQYFMFSGMSEDQVSAIPHLPEGKGLLGAIMREREPIRISDIQADPRSSGFPVNHPDMKRFLGVPIIVGQQLYGMLYLTDRIDGEPFDAQDQWLIESMAGYAALAIAGTQIREQQQHLALLQERERISMDLHDGIIQSIYAIGMNLELARTQEDFDPDSLSDVIEDLNGIIEEIRSYIHDLKTRNFQQKSVYECVVDMVNRLHVPGHLAVEIDAPRDIKMPFSSSTYEALCQMANEAISNVVRHAHASKIRISASHNDRLFRLTIVDDGEGFDPNQPVVNRSSGGLGLRNIQQRARIHGGNIHIDSNHGRGTSITLNIPTKN